MTEITRALSMAILDIAALGFLDLGAQLPSPEWGAMLGDALELIYVAPWTVMLPGAALCSAYCWSTCWATVFAGRSLPGYNNAVTRYSSLNYRI